MAKARGKIEHLGFVGSRIGYLLHRTDVLHMQLIRDNLAGLGLTPARATALALVHENPGCRQSDLGLALGINRASAMELVNSLVALGAMERRDGSDRRSNSLFLTQSGERFFDQFVEISSQVDDVITASLSSDDKARLIALFAQISLNLNQALQVGEGRANS